MKLVSLFRHARSSQELAVLEGFHPVKHALRFGADIEVVVVDDPEGVADLVRRLAPDIGELLLPLVRVVSVGEFARLSDTRPATGVIAISRRRLTDPRAILGQSGPSPVVFLEEPRHLGNVGAVVRVAAAAAVAGVITTGTSDPWGPAAMRGAAGLQYAIPVTQSHMLPRTDRPVVALHPEGSPIASDAIPARSVLAFGGERSGLSDATLDRASLRFRLPMRLGVSSLNLATAVAAVVYSGAVRDFKAGEEASGQVLDLTLS